MNDPHISVIMPVLNAAAFLPQCIESIQHQTKEDWELIVINDHSDDNSFQVIEDYAKADPRIKVFHNDGRGIIEALRMAYQNTAGSLITRMDADDYMAPTKLELMSDELVRYGIGHIAIGYVKYFSESELGNGYINYAKWLNDLTMMASNFSEIYKECSIPSPCWMVHRTDLDLCRAFEPDTYPEDYDLAFRFRKQGLKVIPVTEVLHHWRDHESRASRNDDNYKDNLFAKLKVPHFIDQDYNQQSQLVLWGAGKKGKQIAKLLNEEGVPFLWICDNPNKIGQIIYDMQLHDQSILQQRKELQVIVGISSAPDKHEVEDVMKEFGQHEYYRFC